MPVESMSLTIWRCAAASCELTSAVIPLIALSVSFAKPTRVNALPFAVTPSMTDTSTAPIPPEIASAAKPADVCTAETVMPDTVSVFGSGASMNSTWK